MRQTKARPRVRRTRAAAVLKYQRRRRRARSCMDEIAQLVMQDATAFHAGNGPRPARGHRACTVPRASSASQPAGWHVWATSSARLDDLVHEDSDAVDSAMVRTTQPLAKSSHGGCVPAGKPTWPRVGCHSVTWRPTSCGAAAPGGTNGSLAIEHSAGADGCRCAWRAARHSLRCRESRAARGETLSNSTDRAPRAGDAVEQSGCWPLASARLHRGRNMGVW